MAGCSIGCKHSFRVLQRRWIEIPAQHFVLAARRIAVAHWALREIHRGIVQTHCNMREFEDDEEELPIKLGFRP